MSFLRISGKMRHSFSIRPKRCLHLRSHQQNTDRKRIHRLLFICKRTGRASSFLVPPCHPHQSHLSPQGKKYIFIYVGKYGVNKPIVDSANVDLKSPVFREFVSKREEWELIDHYSNPGPIQYFGEMKKYVPFTVFL